MRRGEFSLFVRTGILPGTSVARDVGNEVAMNVLLPIDESICSEAAVDAVLTGTCPGRNDHRVLHVIEWPHQLSPALTFAEGPRAADCGPGGSRRHPATGQRAGRSRGGPSARGAVPGERVRRRRRRAAHHPRHGCRELACGCDCHRIPRANEARPHPAWQCLRGRGPSRDVPGPGRSPAHAAERLLTGKSYSRWCRL